MGARPRRGVGVSVVGGPRHYRHLEDDTLAHDEMLGSGHSSPSLPLTIPVPNPNTDPIPNPKLGLELGLVIFYVQKWEPGESG